MKEATLAIIVQNEKVLLGFKKKGEIGSQTLNGPGGKTEPGETASACVIRETQEEVGIALDATHLEEIALITFHHDGTPDFRVHVFYTDAFSGEPVETADMIPGWYDIHNLPFDKMLESDREWFAKATRKEHFNANVYYKERAAGFERIEFLTT